MSQMKEEKTEIKLITGIITMLAITIACIVFAILCIYGTNFTFINTRTVLFSVLAALAFSALCAVAIWFLIRRKTTLFKTSISVFVFLLFCLVLIFILQKTGFFEIVNDEKTLQKYLETAGAWMPLLYVLLQYLQVVVLPIPSVVSTVAGVALFGPFKTIIYSLIGIILGSFTAFFIGRKLGHKAVSWMVGEENLHAWQRKLKGKDNFVLTIMFLMPMFPDDILCFIAGLSSMTVRYFSIMILITRTIGVAATCYSVDLIPFNTWWGLMIWGILFVGIGIAFYFIYKNLDKIQAAFSKRFKRSSKKKNAPKGKDEAITGK